MKIFTILKGFSWTEDNYVFRWAYMNSTGYAERYLRDAGVGFRIIKIL